MKTRALVLTMKITIENPTVTATQAAASVEEAVAGEFGKAMWKLGDFADAYVAKVKEKKAK